MNWSDTYLGFPDRRSDFIMGLDLGQANDFTALAVVERTAFPGLSIPIRYAVRHLQRWPLGTRYPDIFQAVGKMVSSVSPRGDRPLLGAQLVLDETGVGRPVADMLKEVPTVARRIVRITITGGLAANFDRSSGSWHVPKKELVSVLQVLMQSERLKVARSLPEADILVKELQTFKVKITVAGNETFENWRERDHDDLVLALALALWYAEKHPPVLHDDDYGVELIGPRKGSWG